MKEDKRIYAAIDLKSFYASVECVARGLNPLTTNLVVADASRTEKTICLAVTPSLKRYGISGRARLFEVVQRLKEVNLERRYNTPDGRLVGESINANELDADPTLQVSYIAAVPRMAYYMQYSQKIFNIYSHYIAPEDILIYSVDEVFIDLTAYLKTYNTTAHELVKKIVRDVLNQTGITATAGIGTNMYLAKVAMDIMAKKAPADKDGVRMAELDEMSYRRQLWNHKPITDFWRVGNGVAKRLSPYGIDTMGKIARCSIHNERLLYDLFGVNAELLIDHAWGWEPCTIAEVNVYRPESNSLSRGQVLKCPYDWEHARIIALEMAEQMALTLFSKDLITDQIVLTVYYDSENFATDEDRINFKGEIKKDHYGRWVPKCVHDSVKLRKYTSLSKDIVAATLLIYDKQVDHNLLVRRLNITVNNVIKKSVVESKRDSIQLELFADTTSTDNQDEQPITSQADKEHRILDAELTIKNKFGNNAILKGTNFKEGSTARERNEQLGGHRG